MEKNIKVGIGVLIFNENKILLGHRAVKSEDTGGIYEPDTWTLPGGKQEYSENIFQCAVREVKEETDLNIEEMTVFNAEDDIQPDRHYVTIQVVAQKYSGELKVMEKDKIDRWEWFSIYNLPDNLYSPSEKFIRKFIENLK